MRPVSISSWARATPTRRGSSHDVPMSQAESPMRMKAALNRAVRRGDADVRAEHEGEAAAGGRPVDGGDHRLGQRAQVRDEVGDEPLHGEAALGRSEVVAVRRRPEAAEVEAGAEAPPGAGQDHDAGIGVDGDVVERRRAGRRPARRSAR